MSQEYGTDLTSVTERPNWPPSNTMEFVPSVDSGLSWPTCRTCGGHSYRDVFREGLAIEGGYLAPAHRANWG